MMDNLEAFQSLLADMRKQFLAELPERCDGYDNLILALEKNPDDRQTFNELCRGIHSLKGSGGTHELGILTTICHQLENFLIEADAQSGWDEIFTSRALAYVDLLRRVEILGARVNPDYSVIEVDLDTLRQATLQNRMTGLVAESSPTMAGIYQAALKDMSVQLTVVDNGLTALKRLLQESYDFVIVGRELKELNGIAVMLALRASQAKNWDVPAIIVTGSGAAIPDHVQANIVLKRDQWLAKNLVAAVKRISHGKMSNHHAKT